MHQPDKLFPTGGGRSAWSLCSQVGDICWSGPGWTSALTGVWRDKHGVSGNTFATAQFDKYPNVFQRLKIANPACVTASVVNWSPLNEFILRPSDHSLTHEDADGRVLDSACSLLRDQGRLDALFVHLDQVDHAGHEHDYGTHITQYMDAIKNTDERCRVILETLVNERASYADEDWLIVVTTDHGGADFTHEDSRPENRTNFLILHGRDVAPGEIFPAPLIVDVAPTMLAHLRVPINTAWHLDGRPVALKLTTAKGTSRTFIDLQASQDPTNLFPIPPEELEEAPAEAATAAD
jgi:hypothetical protein